ncbi:MAG TPA: hypothetical protein PKH54_01835 [Myxococcota bacterium]|nr:hypothetical protein [Myxococcota bacterium]HOA13519.1 hypothetical protein [Myxococcota bacterium]HOC98657.1 hypothetical protein [Myxococcota bacterium]HOH77008.1 hypothetical protein [Myxococcota bacterium]HPV04251.1 hypothetical protein [Myxococcota bacterium]
MRRSVLKNAIAAMSDDDILALAGYLVCRTDADDSRQVWLDFVREILLTPPWSAERMGLVASYPAIRERRPVLEFLGIDDERCRAGGGRFGQWAMEDIPLGVRKAKARLSNRDTLLQLTQDPDPSVARILLDNPFVTEVMALRVTTKRPQKAQILRGVMESRFITSETVQNSLVNNPYCPTRMAVALVPLLSRTHRAETADSGSVDEAVRNAAAAMNL